MHRRGFVLVELLVVIAIIAILAAILFPVTVRTRGKGRQAACTSNIRQIAIGILMYAQDYDERLLLAVHPCAFWPGESAIGHSYVTPNLAYGHLLLPYCKNTNIFICPSGSPADECCRRTYLYPDNLHDPSSVGAPAAGYPLAAFDAAAETVIVQDSADPRTGTNHSGKSSPSDQIVAYRNKGYLDGHVKLNHCLCPPYP